MQMEKAKALNILKSLWMTKLQKMLHMFTSRLRPLMQLHHGNIWPIIHNIQKMKKSNTLNWNPCQNEKLIILQRFSVKLSLSICYTGAISAKQLCKSLLLASILYYVQVTNAEGDKSGILWWGTLSSENACSKTKPVLGGYGKSIRHCSLSMAISTWEESFWGRKGHRRTTRWSNSPGTLPARESLGSALSKSNKNLCWKEGPWGRWLFWIPAASANSPETLQGNRNQGERLSHLRNYWRMVQPFRVHPFP